MIKSWSKYNIRFILILGYELKNKKEFLCYIIYENLKKMLI